MGTSSSNLYSDMIYNQWPFPYIYIIDFMGLLLCHNCVCIIVNMFFLMHSPLRWFIYIYSMNCHSWLQIPWRSVIIGVSPIWVIPIAQRCLISSLLTRINIIILGFLSTVGAGNDALVKAKAGTGKTAAFLVLKAIFISCELVCNIFCSFLQMLLLNKNSFLPLKQF